MRLSDVFANVDVTATAGAGANEHFLLSGEAGFVSGSGYTEVGTTVFTTGPNPTGILRLNRQTSVVVGDFVYVTQPDGRTALTNGGTRAVPLEVTAVTGSGQVITVDGSFEYDAGDRVFLRTDGVTYTWVVTDNVNNFSISGMYPAAESLTSQQNVDTLGNQIVNAINADARIAETWIYAPAGGGMNGDIDTGQFIADRFALGISDVPTATSSNENVTAVARVGGGVSDVMTIRWFEGTTSTAGLPTSTFTITQPSDEPIFGNFLPEQVAQIRLQDVTQDYVMELIRDPADAPTRPPALRLVANNPGDHAVTVEYVTDQTAVNNARIFTQTTRVTGQNQQPSYISADSRHRILFNYGPDVATGAWTLVTNVQPSATGDFELLPADLVHTISGRITISDLDTTTFPASFLTGNGYAPRLEGTYTVLAGQTPAHVLDSTGTQIVGSANNQFWRVTIDGIEYVFDQSAINEFTFDQQGNFIDTNQTNPNRFVIYAAPLVTIQGAATAHLNSGKAMAVGHIPTHTPEPQPEEWDKKPTVLPAHQWSRAGRGVHVNPRKPSFGPQIRDPRIHNPNEGKP